MAIMRLYQVANSAKERLSTTTSTKVVLAPFIQEPFLVNLQMEISREAFILHPRKHPLDDTEEIFLKMQGKSVKDLIQETLYCIQKCLEMAHLKAEEIDEIFLVGGTSSIPEVRKQIEITFKKEPFQTKISPALSISTGAAYYCNLIMLPTMKGPKVSEKTIHPLGLEIAGRRFLEVVGRDLDIPKEGLVIEAPELLETNFDGLTSMAIAGYEDLLPEERLKFVYEKGMKRLAGTTLRGIPVGCKGQEKVRVFFKIGQDNMMTVEAKSTSLEGVVTQLTVDKMY
ncbi:MAG: Hsp70 family protein, partial [Vallitaleaceae bacterium]|nr:Hsp70 family protein [Vallitaleaceae bacterium]